jgi:hypothetical protein
VRFGNERIKRHSRRNIHRHNAIMDSTTSLVKHPALRGHSRALAQTTGVTHRPLGVVPFVA